MYVPTYVRSENIKVRPEGGTGDIQRKVWKSSKQGRWKKNLTRKTERPAWLGVEEGRESDKANKVSTPSPCRAMVTKLRSLDFIRYKPWGATEDFKHKSSPPQTTDFILERTMWGQHREWTGRVDTGDWEADVGAAGSNAMRGDGGLISGLSSRDRIKQARVRAIQ